MKVYLDHFRPSTIPVERFEPYMRQEKTYMQLDSEERGRIIIVQQNQHQAKQYLETSLETTYQTIEYRYHRNVLSLVICNDRDVLRPLLSQLPVKSIVNFVVQRVYKLHAQSSLALVIEFDKDEVPQQFFFECDKFVPEQLFFRSEFDELLSMLLKS
jgi:hypothetical protein